MNGVAASQHSKIARNRFRFGFIGAAAFALTATNLSFCGAAQADTPVLKIPQSASRHAPLPPAAPPLPMKPLPQASTVSAEPGLLLARGVAYARLGDYSRAIDAYSSALKNRPSDAGVLLARAQAFLSRSKAIEQIKAADKTLRSNPKGVQTRLHRAFSYYNIGEYDKAIADYDAVLDEKPDYVAAYLGRALAHVADESWGDAAADYRRAFLLRPDLIPASHEPSDFHLLVEHD